MSANVMNSLEMFDRHTLIIVVGGMQCVSRSYNRARTCNSRAGDRSARISSAVNAIRASQSGGGIGVSSDTFSLVTTRGVSLREYKTLTRDGRTHRTSEHRSPRT